MFTDGRRVFEFEKDTYKYGNTPIVMNWTSGADPDVALYHKAQWFKITFTMVGGSDESFTVTFTNEKNESKSVSVSQGDSDKIRWLGLNGHRFHYTVSHADDKDLDIRQVYLYDKVPKAN